MFCCVCKETKEVYIYSHYRSLEEAVRGKCMKIFLMKDKEVPSNDEVFFFIDDKYQRCHIEVVDDYTHFAMPLYLEWSLDDGHSFNNYTSLKLIQKRVVPPDRQNIAAILKAHNLREYNPIRLFIDSKGRCCQDECYIRKIKEDNLPEEIRKRLEKRIESVFLLSGTKLLITFVDVAVKTCDIQELEKGNRFFSRILKDEEDFQSFFLDKDGFGVYWNNDTEILYSELYDNGTTLSLTAEDVHNLFVKNIFDSGEAQGLLHCTRQYIFNRKDITPIKKTQRTTMFLKSDIAKSRKY